MCSKDRHRPPHPPQKAVDKPNFLRGRQFLVALDCFRLLELYVVVLGWFWALGHYEIVDLLSLEDTL